MKKIIVKVQIQLNLPFKGAVPEVMCYDKDRKNTYTGEATKEILKAMDGEPKKFFFAEIPKKAGIIEIGDEAPWQDW